MTGFPLLIPSLLLSLLFSFHSSYSYNIKKKKNYWNDEIVDK